MATDKKIAAMKKAWIADAARLFDHYLSFGCESPIEQLLLGAMLTGDCQGSWSKAELYDWLRLWDLAKEIASPREHNRQSMVLTCSSYGSACVTQCNVTIGPSLYRIDFAFFDHTRRRRYAVELDGHDFHERTKEQAERDRSRDRALTAAGWVCLRFTGREVYRDPGACLDQIETFLIRDANAPETAAEAVQ